MITIKNIQSIQSLRHGQFGKCDPPVIILLKINSKNISPQNAWLCEYCKSKGRGKARYRNHMIEHYKILSENFNSLCLKWNSYLSEYEKRNQLFYEQSSEIRKSLSIIESLLNQPSNPESN